MRCYFIEDVNLFCVLDESLGSYKSRQPTKLYWESIFHDFRSEVKEDISFTKKGLDVGNAISQQYAMCLNFEQFLFIYLFGHNLGIRLGCVHIGMLQL